MELNEVITAFEKFDGKYKREEVDFALEHQEEITPFLIDILQKVIKEPYTFAADENYYGHIYALILLGYFKEKKAHDLLIELFSLPDDIIEDLYGDIAFGNFKIALYQTCNGSVNKIKEMALNKHVADSSRNSAIGALLYAVADGVITRDDALTFLTTLFTGDETDQNSTFWSFIACDICDLCPDEHAYEVIKNAYANNLIDDGIVGFEEFQEAIDLGVEKSLIDLKRDKERDIPEDIHRTMSWWACFEENDLLNIKSSSNYIKRKSSNRKKKPKKKVKKHRVHKKKKKKRK